MEYKVKPIWKPNYLKISLSTDENDLKNQYPFFRLDKYSSGRNLNPENVFYSIFNGKKSIVWFRIFSIFFLNEKTVQYFVVSDA